MEQKHTNLRILSEDVEGVYNSRELIKVVRSLLRFIVIESKGFIDNDKIDD